MIPLAAALRIDQELRGGGGGVEGEQGLSQKLHATVPRR